MTSPDERREVAARLRRDVGESSCIDYAVFRIAHEVLGIEHVTGAKAAHMLADLIDPTCEVESVELRDECDEATPYTLTLSCGHRMGAESHGDIPMYCPSCGCRVVSHDD